MLDQSYLKQKHAIGKRKRIELWKDDRIRLLEDENRALKAEIRALKKRKISKLHVCPICKKAYARSDGLYKHLQNGDEEHRRLATERYETKCLECGKECTRWGDLKKHMAKHEQKWSADDLNLESDASTSYSCNFRTSLC